MNIIFYIMFIILLFVK